MGGWTRDDPPPRNFAKEHIEEFYKLRDPAKRAAALQEAYTACEKRSESLISNIIANQGQQPQNGLAGIEIEMKLALPSPPNGLERKMQSIALPSNPSDRFLQISKCESQKGNNHYYGTATEERFVILENDTGGYIKLKGGSQPYGFGVPGEEYVLRRTESLKEVMRGSSGEGLVALADIILKSMAAADVRYTGTMEKSKVTQFAVERNTGRVYSLVLSVCKAKNREPLTQLEIEYAGYLPRFPAQQNIESERKIVEDILEMALHFQRQGLAPTTLTKFDWLAGNPERKPVAKPAAPKAPPGPLTAKQTFFDEPVSGQ